MATVPQVGYGANNSGLPAPVKPVFEDIGPFRRHIFNKLVRGTSAITSLIALILHFSILGQGLTVALKPASINDAEEQERGAARATTSRRRSSSTPTRTTRSTRTSSASTESPTELLGRTLPTTSTIQTSFAKPTPTSKHLAQRMVLKIRQNNRDGQAETLTFASEPAIFTYVPNTDVPARDGAIGFTAVSHLSAASIILLLFWLEWLLFMRKPTFFSYWGPLIIAGVQLFMAFDILGRSIPVAAQAGGYVLLLMAVINVFLAGWTVLLARRKLAPPLLPSAPPPVQQATFNPPAQTIPVADVYAASSIQPDPLPMMDSNAMLYMDEKQDLQAQDVHPNSREQERLQAGSLSGDVPHGSLRRASTGSRYANDHESHYSRSPPTRRDRRRSYSYGAKSQDYILPPSVPAVDDIPATSPISLYGPEEYRRRVEQQRRSRRRSLVQPALQFDPNTGNYVQPAGTFVQRSLQALHNVEEEEEEAARNGHLNATDPKLRQDGFANRTRVWKRLQRNSGII